MMVGRGTTGVGMGEAALAEDQISFLDPNAGRAVRTRVPRSFLNTPLPVYRVDLTGDGKKEGIHFINRDGKDRISIRNGEGREFAVHSFQAVGLDATPFKIWLRSLSPDSKVLIVYYYEGYTDYLKFLGSVRLYFFTFENNDLSTLSMHRGAPVFYEYADKKKSYRQRRYRVEVVDFNGDGRRDILIKYSHIMDIFLYRGKGKWLHQTKPVI